MSNKTVAIASTTPPAAAGSPTKKSRGLMIMRTVSMFVSTARRTSNDIKQRAAEEAAEQQRGNSKSRRSKMGERAVLAPKMLDSFAKRTHFNKADIGCLYKIYQKLVTHSNVTSKAIANAANSVIAKPFAPVDGIDRNCFRELLHTTFDIVVEDFVMDRIFVAWEKGHDMQPLKFEGFLLGLSVFLRGTLSERIAFNFRVYDLNGDGYIAKEEMFTLLRNSMIQQPQDDDPDESIKDLMDFIMRKMDGDGDGRISYADFETCVKAEPLMVEAFGNCLPSAPSVFSFMSTLNNLK